MHYLGESVIVGGFSGLIYLCTYMLVTGVCNIYLPLLLIVFKTGFLKHFIGYYLVHSLYCQYGYACQLCENNTNTREAKHISIYQLIIECVLEGISFVIIISLLQVLLHVDQKYTIILVCVTGSILHILCELLNIHKQFCSERCNNI
jgi:hypothetical protein